MDGNGILNNGNVGIGTTNPGAILDLDVSNRADVDKTGFLPPRMTTTQRDAIVTPAQGSVIYNIDSGSEGLNHYNGASWQSTGEGGAFGSWTNLDSASDALVKNAIYKVGSDGFVCAAAYGSGHGDGTIVGYTDGTNATTRRVGSGSGYVDVHWSGITMPVKKGDYWKVTTYRMQTPSISWIPIGNGSCVKQE